MGRNPEVVNDPNQTRPIHILLAEDHALVRRMLIRTLISSGYQVTAAEDGDQALKLLEHGTDADILLSDIRMPGSMDGFMLARWVQQNRPNMVILLQSAYSNLDTGEFRLLRKPFSAEELAQALKDVLSG